MFHWFQDSIHCKTCLWARDRQTETLERRRILLKKWGSCMRFTYFFFFQENFSVSRPFQDLNLSRFICFCSRGIKGYPLQENTDLTTQMLNAKPYPILLLWQVYSQRCFCDICTERKIYLKESGLIKPNHSAEFAFFFGCIRIPLWNGPPLGMKTNEAKSKEKNS